MSTAAISHNTTSTVAKMTRAEAQILAHYSAGETVIQIAKSTGALKDDIDFTIDALAGGNRGRARDLALEWQTRVKAVAAARGHADPTIIPAPARPAPPVHRVPALPAVTAAAQDTGADLIADLLNRARISEIPRLVRAAEKITELVDQLGQQLTAHEQEQKLRDEAAKLEARLAEIKQQLNPKRPVLSDVDTSSPLVDAKAVRAWAVANNVECPDRGRIPGNVLAAYQQQGS